MNNTFCIIMAGGIGSRFWPISTAKTPKQFLDILGVGKTLLQLTFDRIQHICPPEHFFIVTNKEYKDIVLTQLPQISELQVLLEPTRRNTAPCIAYGVHEIKKINPQASIIVAPSDHFIVNEQEFLSVLTSSLSLVEQHDILLTLGIKPTRPDTGYGYIQLDKQSFVVHNHLVNKVKTFTEKPSLEIAKFFVDSNEFFWNSGIFIWSVSSILKAFEVHLPFVYSLFEHELSDSSNISLLERVYSECPSVSIDYGVMEKADNVHVMQTDFGWSDLGTWGALYEQTAFDDKSNAIIGDNVICYEASGNMISVPSHKLVVIDGIHDCIVVDSGDKLLICNKSDEQKIRHFVKDIKISKGDSFL
jgi:mannose-1-phosphate guanylyltransferase